MTILPSSIIVYNDTNEWEKSENNILIWSFVSKCCNMWQSFDSLVGGPFRNFCGLINTDQINWFTKSLKGCTRAVVYSCVATAITNCYVTQRGNIPTWEIFFSVSKCSFHIKVLKHKEGVYVVCIVSYGKD